MTKVSFFDKRVFNEFLKVLSTISVSASLIFLFVEIPADKKIYTGIAFLGLLGLAYLAIWFHSNNLNKVDIQIQGSNVTIKVDDLFNQPELKTIAFNEYFDTQVDNVIITDKSLNGIFIKNHLDITVDELDEHIKNYNFVNKTSKENSKRKQGKKTSFQIGTICIYKDFLLTAFSKFDIDNKAVLTMPEYLEFLINFWDNVNYSYGQRSVSTPIFGSGITRIKNHRTIDDEDLLKIMLWTFQISEMRFKHPAKLTIVIHKDKIDKINLHNIKSIWDS